MGASRRIGLYGAGLAAVFAAALAVGGTVIPEQTVQDWNRTTEEHDMEATPEHGEHAPAATEPRGLGIEQDGYLLGAVTAPTGTGTADTLSFTITDTEGAPVTEYGRSHEKELHLIVVRTDGTGFRHVHPDIDIDGVWSLPWEWDTAGAYRVFADFVPAATGEDVTLTRTVEVGGETTATEPAAPSLTDTVDGFDVALEGELHAGESSPLTLTVSRDGEPVTSLEPYLGAWGHLVALREGDLAYLHVHPEGAEPEAGETSGPTIEFATTAPTPGRYLLYLDFQVDNRVHTAQFTVEAH